MVSRIILYSEREARNEGRIGEKKVGSEERKEVGTEGRIQERNRRKDETKEGRK